MCGSEIKTSIFDFSTFEVAQRTVSGSSIVKKALRLVKSAS